MKRPTLWLNMIVKNESHILPRLLESVLPWVDGYCICDTGSTDTTWEILERILGASGLPGKLLREPFVDFATTRNVALRAADGLSDFLLLIDADMVIDGDVALFQQWMANAAADTDAIHVLHGNAHFFTENIRLVRNNGKSYYIGVTHEVLVFPPTFRIHHVPRSLLFFNNVADGGSKTDKYTRDIRLLLEGIRQEESLPEHKTSPSLLHSRYHFYLANSYFDNKQFSTAVEWYLKTLALATGWEQEKYVCCLRLYQVYSSGVLLGFGKETGFYYLVKALGYDPERAEALWPLLQHYCAEGKNEIAYSYYRLVQPWYETLLNKSVTEASADKLFVEVDKMYFFVPYMMIIASFQVKQYATGLYMFRLLFTKKHPFVERWWIGNLFHNFGAFIEHMGTGPERSTLFAALDGYLQFLHDQHDYDLVPHRDTLAKYATVVASETPFLQEWLATAKIPVPCTTFSVDVCRATRNVLLYTGFHDYPWNETYRRHHALGGSETAAACWARAFPACAGFRIFVTGHVQNETVEDGNDSYTRYVDWKGLPDLLATTPFHTVVVSRYIGFFDMFPQVSAAQRFVWLHDTDFLPYTHHPPWPTTEDLLQRHGDRIDAYVFQTTWHSDHIHAKYSAWLPREKLRIINNGIEPESFPWRRTKVRNKFLYSSCVERGLSALLELWPRLRAAVPDATLVIAGYNPFPKISHDPRIDEFAMHHFIQQHSDSIRHVGRLSRAELYEEMATTDGWLYPTDFTETSCITALEMLYSGVVCLYYPVAGLVDTLGDYGVVMERGREVDAWTELTDEAKDTLRERGRKYARGCSWRHRNNVWLNEMGFDLSRRCRYIFSLTTLPSRLPRLAATLDSLLHQKLSPDAIYVHVPTSYTLRPDLSSSGNGDTSADYYYYEALKKRYAGDRVFFHPVDADHGPGTKLTGILEDGLLEDWTPVGNEKNDTTYVVCVDDDLLYDPAMLAHFDEWQRTHPNKNVPVASYYRDIDQAFPEVPQGQGADGFFFRVEALSGFRAFFQRLLRGIDSPLLLLHDDLFLSYYAAWCGSPVQPIPLPPDISVIYQDEQCQQDALQTLQGFCERKRLTPLLWKHLTTLFPLKVEDNVTLKNV